MGFMHAIKRLFTIKESVTVIRYMEMTPEQKEGIEKAFSMMDDAFKEMDKVFGLTTTPVDGS